MVRFVQSLTPADTFVSVLSLGELRRGAAIRAKRDLPASQALDEWIDGIEADYLGRIFTVTQEIARIWGELSATRTRPIVDTLLAATAIHHRLTLVRRNVRDVQDTPVTLHNPWQGA